MNLNQGDRFIVYRDRMMRWQWRITRSNNRIIADSAQGYATKAGALSAVMRLKKTVPVARVKVAATVVFPPDYNP